MKSQKANAVENNYTINAKMLANICTLSLILIAVTCITHAAVLDQSAK